MSNFKCLILYPLGNFAWQNYLGKICKSECDSKQNDNSDSDGRISISKGVSHTSYNALLIMSD